MPTATTARRLAAEYQKQIRMKQRVHAWWQAERSPARIRGLTVIPLDRPLPQGLAAALGRMAGDTDETPPKAH